MTLLNPVHDITIPVAMVATAAVIGGRWVALGVLAPIGLRAYSLYLWNWPMTLLFGSIGALAPLLTILVGEISYRLLEAPVLHRGGAGASPSRSRRDPSGEACSVPRGGPGALTAAMAIPPRVRGARRHSLRYRRRRRRHRRLCPPSRGAPPPPSADILCILVLGDSIAEGVPIPKRRPVVARLRQLLQAEPAGRTITIDSWAVSGSQIEVLESAARDQPELGTYDVAIVIEGVNDQHRLSADAWKPRYEAASRGIRGQGRDRHRHHPAAAVRGRRLRDALRRLRGRGPGRRRAGRACLDLAARWRADGPTLAGTYYVDSVHQSVAGQIVMAAAAHEVVLAAVNATDAP